METGAIIIAILQALPYIVTAAAGTIAIWKSLKAKQYKETAKLGVETLQDLITGIELMPQTDTVKRIKRVIQAVAMQSGTEEAMLERVVNQTVEALEKAGMLTPDDQTRPVDIALAVRAVREAREAREKLAANGVAKTLGLWLLGISLAVFCLGCTAESQRLTTEIVFPGDALRGQPGELTILWPNGVRKAELYSTEIASRTLTVAPLR